MLNRAVARLPLFEKPADDAAFLRVLDEALHECPVRLLAFVLMPNHWHVLLWPLGDRDLTDFCCWLAHTHSRRWHAPYHTSGTGHLYQDRVKSFCVEGDDYLYTVARYMERNPLRANLVPRAEHGRWSSLWRRVHGDTEPGPLLSAWPVPLPADWVAHVRAPQTEAELEALRRSARRGCPFGTVAWQTEMAARQGLSHTLRPLGRPRKREPTESSRVLFSFLDGSG